MSQMDLDRKLFQKAENSTDLPLVRVYTWDKPTITYGYNQKIDELIDLNHYKDWEILKRPTGGGIVFHEKGEISFTVIFPREKLTVPEAVGITSKKIATFLGNLGLDIKIEVAKRSQAADLCSNFVSSYEITLNGKKLVGIAQRFGRKSILQQGTIFGQYPEIKTMEFEKCLKSSKK